MIVHIMHDLETWGTDPGHDLRSIGACVFDPFAGIVLTGDHTRFYRAVENPSVAAHHPLAQTKNYWHHDAARPQEYMRYPLTRDPQTVAWWNDQSPEAQGAFADPVDLRQGLEEFAAWLGGFGPDIRLWSHGENMDEPMLRVAYKAVGLSYTVAGRTQAAPWHYRAPRDTRTMFEAAGMDPVTCIEPYTLSTGGIYHHALHDSIAQAHAVCEAFKRVARWRKAAAYVA
jgi:hypothetical protein